MTHIDNGPGPGWNYGETAILHILHILASFLECKKAIFFKWPAMNRLWVYNVEFFFVASTHPVAPYILRRRQNSKKNVLWNTLLNRQHTAHVRQYGPSKRQSNIHPEPLQYLHEMCQTGNSL